MSTIQDKQQQRSELSSPSIGEPNNFISCNHHPNSSMAHHHHLHHLQQYDEHMKLRLQQHQQSHQQSELQPVHTCLCTHHHHNIVPTPQQPQLLHYRRYGGSNCPSSATPVGTGFVTHHSNYNSNGSPSSLLHDQCNESLQSVTTASVETHVLTSHPAGLSSLENNSSYAVGSSGTGPVSSSSVTVAAASVIANRPPSRTSLLHCECGANEQSGRSSRIVSTDDNNPSGSEDSGRKCNSRLNRYGCM